MVKQPEKREIEERMKEWIEGGRDEMKGVEGVSKNQRRLIYYKEQ